MRIVFAIAYLSFKEGIKQRLLYGILIFALVMNVSAVLLSGFFMRDISKIILDFCLSAISIGGLLVPFFLAIDLLSKDLERKTIFTILALPLSRKTYIWGKFTGMAVLSFVVMAILTVATFAAIWSGHILYGPQYFMNFSAQSVLISIFIAWLGINVLNSLVILWCILTTSSFLATLLTLATYIIGQSIDDVVNFITIETPGVQISTFIKKVVLIVQYIFPNLSAFDYKQLAAHGLNITLQETVLISSYAVCYSSIVLILATLCFQKRDIT